jgi:hypothetical protein
MRPHHEITDIPELQPGQPLQGAGRGATAFYGVRGGWSGIATGYLLVILKNQNWPNHFLGPFPLNVFIIIMIFLMFIHCML